MTKRVYLDCNATALLRPQARSAMLAALELWGNASSVHAEGRAARSLIEHAREQVAELVGGKAKNVTFTSGGTEANMLALTPSTGCDRLFTSAIEHPSVRSGGRYPADIREEIPVTAAGIVDLVALRERIRKARRPLVSVMAANNETGVLQPISEVAEIVREVDGLLVVDAVQWVGRLASRSLAEKAQVVTLSAHKIGGARGAGAVIRLDDRVHLDPLLTGGGQERGARAGTENVAAIAAFGAAAAAVIETMAEESSRMLALRDRLEAGLRERTPGLIVFGADVERLPNTTLFTAPSLKAETAVIAFDLEGIAVSSGAACSSGKVAASHVLTAMGVEASLARGAVRVSLGWHNTEADVEAFLNAWTKVSSSLLKEQRGIAA